MLPNMISYIYTERLGEIFNIPNIGILLVDTSMDEKWDCYNDAATNIKKNTTYLYWNNLTEQERNDRLENHGMTGKKHSQKTIEKMRASRIGVQNQKLQKNGILQKEGVVVKFQCLSHFCKEHCLSAGHICELLQGKRKSVKGWKNVI